MSYKIRGLASEPFEALYGMDDAGLAARGAIRVIADAKPGYPDRVTLRDAEPGQALLLLNHQHQPAETPYRSSHAIFVLEGATDAAEFVDELPPVFASRTLSLRAFDGAGMMVDAALASGEAIEPLIERLLEREDTAYVHAHNAGRGCFAALIERA